MIYLQLFQSLEDIIKRQFEFINYLHELDKELDLVANESSDLSEFFSEEFTKNMLWYN